VAARVKFAVVREDPDLERAVIEKIGAKHVLLVASGGCTALTLAVDPELEITAFDINEAQLEHVREKAQAAFAGEHKSLNVGDPSASGLNQRGAFEGLFRILRATILELVTDEFELEAFFMCDTAQRRVLLDRWRMSPYWPAAFATAFNDPLLHAMFGPDATQHATAGSYPGYFQRVFERGLAREDAATNPFLQHVFLGMYRSLSDAPDYIRAQNFSMVELIHGTLTDVPDLERFDLFSLSNVFDWSNDAQIAAWAEAIRARAHPGSAILIRQLNNTRDVRRFFAPVFEFDDQLAVELLARDRSLFYERIEVGYRAREP
jgi:S-adenosylmethionine-diacylglycerol 3-amino-3-carboxypropyl transferase